MSSRPWADLFERAVAHETGVEAIRTALAARREERQDDRGDHERGGRGGDPTRDDPEADRDDPDADGDTAGAGGARRAARVVADADVLAADLLAGDDPDPADGRSGAGQSADPPDSGDPARAAMDLVRSHSWLALVASDPLLDDAAAVVADLADDVLAADWRATAASLATLVDHPPADHPALAAALAGDAGHLLSYDDALTGPRAGVAVRQHVETSVRTPDAFVSVFDAGSLYAAVEGGSYPGPDRDPRA